MGPGPWGCAVIDGATLGVFVAAVLLLLLSPGPNMAFVIAHGVALGWRGGLAAAAGIALADVVLTLVTAAGLTAAVVAWPPTLELLRYGGALYLLRLAWLAATQRRAAVPQAAAPGSLRQIGLQAALNSLLNPKALLFFMVFLPSFTQPGQGALALQLQLLVLGSVLTAVAAVFHALLGVLSDRARHWATGGRARSAWASRALAAVFTALALRLLWADLRA
ncbi:LysE family translocator [Ideonella sp. BN130291]|uniref:LysE family translocator n=1 Tax=Ideonella sp. BN130291 TaxID=3112940 RepID=UPI002E274A07|nr:LysE family translocator [Ideonella sp. BN130291]